MDSDWTWTSPDNTIKKRILSVGTRRIHPFDCSKCRVKFLDFSVEDGKTLENCPEAGLEKEIVIGTADNAFGHKLDLLLLTMVAQEVAECEFKLNDIVCHLKVELIQCQLPSKPLHRLTEEEKLAEAEKLKVRASELIKSNRYEDAIPILRRAFKCVCWAGGNIQNDFSELYFSVIANLSLCSLKLNNNERTVSLCNLVLKHRPNHVKCLLRRATALDALQETERAKKDVQLAIAIEPNNKMAEQLLDKIRTHMAIQHTEFTVLAKKMLQLE